MTELKINLREPNTPKSHASLLCALPLERDGTSLVFYFLRWGQAWFSSSKRWFEKNRIPLRTLFCMSVVCRSVSPCTQWLGTAPSTRRGPRRWSPPPPSRSARAARLLARTPAPARRGAGSARGPRDAPSQRRNPNPTGPQQTRQPRGPTETTTRSFPRVTSSGPQPPWQGGPRRRAPTETSPLSPRQA